MSGRINVYPKLPNGDIPIYADNSDFAVLLGYVRPTGNDRRTGENWIVVIDGAPIYRPFKRFANAVHYLIEAVTIVTPGEHTP